MPMSDPAQILLAHDRWATGQVIDACRPLTGEQFHQRFEIGLGSLHDTIAHNVTVIRGWTDMLAARERRDPVDKDGPCTLDKLASLLNDACDEFAAWTPPAMDGAEIVSRERDGKTYSFTRGAVLTHVTTHNTHHRAQCLNMLRQLGQEGPWRVSVVEWTFEQSV